MDGLSEHQKRFLRAYRRAHAVQEIGVLLIALAPLDGLVGTSELARDWKIVLGLVLVGAMLFELGVTLERGLHDAE